MLIPVLSVAENVVLGQEIVRAGEILDLGEAAARIGVLAKKLDRLDPRARSNSSRSVSRSASRS